MKHRTPTIWLLALLAIPLLAFGLRLWGLNVSETWDEVAYYDAAAHYYDNVKNDRWADAQAWEANREHPAVAKWLYLLPSLSAFEAGVSDLNPGRLLSAALGAVTVLITMLLARRLFDWRVGIVAGAILALLPTVIALNRVLGLDTPFAFFFVLSIYFFVKALERASYTSQESGHRPNSCEVVPSRYYSLLTTHYSLPSWFWHVLAALAVGLTIGTRLTGVLLIPILGLITLIHAGTKDNDLRLTTNYSLVRTWRFILRPATILWALLYVLIPAAAVYATWPWLWSNTAAHWQITIGHWAPVSSFFLGVLQQPGPGYYLHYFLVSFPALFVLASIFWLAKAIVRGSKADWILVVWILVVLSFSLYGLRQGGFRYLLPAVPALAIAIAAYLIDLTTRMNDRKAAWLLPSMFILYLIPHAVLHQPYQLDYYNELTGGTGRVAEGKTFQVGWWGEGVDEAVDWLNAHAPYDATISFTALPDRAQRRLRLDFDHTQGLPDYILTNPSYSWYLSEYPGLRTYYHRVYAVEAQGAVLAAVWKRK